MPQQAWSKKRERQYDHIKEGLEDSGRSEDEAEEIAARTVNKERARHGEAEREQPDVDRGHLLLAARRPAVPLRPGRPDPRPALQRGEAEEHQGPLEDDQGRAREGRRSLAFPDDAGGDRPPQRRGHVGRGPRQPGPRHGPRRGGARAGHGADDPARGHGERSRHRPRRPHLHRGRLARSRSPATPTTDARSPPAPRSGSWRRPGGATYWWRRRRSGSGRVATACTT